MKIIVLIKYIEVSQLKNKQNDWYLLKIDYIAFANFVNLTLYLMYSLIKYAKVYLYIFKNIFLLNLYWFF